MLAAAQEGRHDCNDKTSDTCMHKSCVWPLLCIAQSYQRELRYLEQNLLGRPMLCTLSILYKSHWQALGLGLPDMVVRSKGVLSCCCFDERIVLLQTAKNIPFPVLPKQAALQCASQDVIS